HTIEAQPFNLEEIPLFRAALLKLASQQYEFIFNIHHILADGWSLALLRKEFIQIYQEYDEGKTALPEAQAFRYRDFAQWHYKQLQDKHDEGNPAVAYWQKALANGLPAMQLPQDYSDDVEAPRGAAYWCALEQNVKQQLQTLAEKNKTTLFAVMFTAYLAILAQVTGQQEVGSSIIVAGREHDSLHGIVGLFVNSVLISMEIDENETFETQLKKVSTQLMTIFQYQGYPMEPVFRALGMKYPKVPVSFNM
ncbi:MAG: hypothetical protein GY765_29350, partial [bacterium]|nr:hypothetical protein [bacterium]